MKVAAAGGAEGRIGWITAFGRSDLGREILRRMPARIRRRVWASRRWQRRVAAQLRSRWHRSLQLRVVATTLLLSALVIAVLGFFLVNAIANGMLSSAQKAATNQVENALVTAGGLPAYNMRVTPPNGPYASSAMRATAESLQKTSGTSGSFFVGLTTFPVYLAWAGPYDINPEKTIPTTLISKVDNEQKATKVLVWMQPTSLTLSDGSVAGPALVAGAPLGTSYQLYYVYPFIQEQANLLLVQKILIGVGIALVALLAAIASLVTRWVVLPVRHAAEAAQLFTAGRLDERMRVLGSDDLAALATSFNEMAASLQDKLRELEELSSVQRQFVSDVSHELRTPLATIKMAAEILFDSRDELDPAVSRPVELLQSQVERFEGLLVDLLEISRYDARAATLEAEPVDVCDIVRRSADDAQQLAERKGSRIEFRLPAEGCFAEVDRRRVERILRNILVNAVEHGEGKDVIVTAAADSDAVAVGVRDFGVGLAPGEEQLVFDRFWRADASRARTTGGTGLGLAISLEDARLHGGWLQAWGERGKGSVFRLTVPRTAGKELAGSPLPLEPDDTEIVSISGAGAYPGPDIPGAGPNA
ncbi:MAG TPA: MtrAB system histidine kinase MtrB [Streptosporangiaceae bacterium]|nr:MtrAB system histidine kinase MtrB [Streptosporangiaceae bacterium]